MGSQRLAGALVLGAIASSARRLAHAQPPAATAEPTAGAPTAGGASATTRSTARAPPRELGSIILERAYIEWRKLDWLSQVAFSTGVNTYLTPSIQLKVQYSYEQWVTFDRLDLGTSSYWARFAAAKVVMGL